MTPAPAPRPRGASNSLVGQEVEVKAGCFDHLRQLAGGQGVVDIRHAGSRLVVTADLELLRGAGHDRDDDHVLGVDPHLFGVPGLGNRAEHLLGGLAGGEVRDEFREVVFAVLDPAGGAGGDHRQGAAVLHPLDQLVGLFHDGQVGPKRRCRRPCAKPIRRRAATILPSTLVPIGRPKASPSAGADGRGSLDDDGLFGVGQGRPDGVGRYPFPARAPVGQAAMHWPQETQATSARSWSKAVPMWVAKPRSFGPMTPQS